MQAYATGDVLRIALFSAFLGFATFCASYAFHVWRKRNRNNRPAAPWMTRLGVAAFSGGLIGFAGCWAESRFAQRDGIVGGDELFVVHARRDSNVGLAMVN